jgi:mycofactocin precursor
MSSHHNVNRPTQVKGVAIADRVHIDVPLDNYLDRPIDGAHSTVDEQVVDELVAEEALVEEVSIDGMCGVY